MRQQVYTAKAENIIFQSCWIWVFIALQIVANFHSIFEPPLTNTYLIIFFNMVFLCVNIPGLLIFFNYYKHSANRRLTVTDNAILFNDSHAKSNIMMLHPDITKIEYIQSSQSTRNPWKRFGYFCFSDVHDKKIAVPSFIAGIEDLWFDNLATRLNYCKLTTMEKILPLIKNH